MQGEAYDHHQITHRTWVKAVTPRILKSAVEGSLPSDDQIYCFLRSATLSSFRTGHIDSSCFADCARFVQARTTKTLVSVVYAQDSTSTRFEFQGGLWVDPLGERVEP